jgi:DNA polymerase III sliding clamp (beta) subunit (PCNA family)
MAEENIKEGDNNEWLEVITENFYITLSDGDYVEAQRIINRVKEEGFDVEAKQLKEALLGETGFKRA